MSFKNFRTKLRAFEILASLTVRLKNKHRRDEFDPEFFFKDVNWWEPKQGVDFELLNKVIIQRTTGAKQWFEVKDKHDKVLYPFQKEVDCWKFSSQYPLTVLVEDEETNELFAIDIFYEKRDGKFSLQVEREVRDLNSEPVFTIEPEIVKPMPRNGNGKSKTFADPDPQLRKAVHLKNEKENNPAKETSGHEIPVTKKDKLTKAQKEVWEKEGKTPPLIQRIDLSAIA